MSVAGNSTGQQVPESTPRDASEFGQCRRTSRALVCQPLAVAIPVQLLESCQDQTRAGESAASPFPAKHFPIQNLGIFQRQDPQPRAGTSSRTEPPQPHGLRTRRIRNRAIHTFAPS